MRSALFILLIFSSVAAEANKIIIGDHGVFLNSERFSAHCIINDPGISGSNTIDAYTHGQLGCDRIQEIYSKAYSQLYSYLITHGYELNSSAPVKTLAIRILTLAELNSSNFSMTDPRCMNNINCSSGAFFGRTFTASDSSNINVYIVYSKQKVVNPSFSFVSTFKHELMHAILYRYRLGYILNTTQQHVLIEDFLRWADNQ